jgi:glutathione S-transferase
VKLSEYPHVEKWKELVGSRPAVQKGMKVLEI